MYLCTHVNKSRTMELRCPQCGKLMVMSQEELVIHDSQVVCPQCLAVCRYIDGALVVHDDSDAPYRHTASVTSTKQETTKFCHHCGKKLPDGIKFCPYCGADLSAPFSQPKAVDKKPEPARVQAKPQEAKPVEAKVEQPKPSSGSQVAHNQVEDKLRTMSRHYSNSMRPQLHQNGTMPSRGFKIVAYTIIIALLVVLVGIIIAGLNIEPTL